MSNSTQEILIHYRAGCEIVKDTSLPEIYRASMGLYLAGISFTLTKAGVEHERIPDIEDGQRTVSVPLLDKGRLESWLWSTRKGGGK
jgi:hypothetical protein